MLANGGYTSLATDSAASGVRLLLDNKEKVLKYAFIAGIIINLFVFVFVTHHHSGSPGLSPEIPATPSDGLMISVGNTKEYLQPLDFQNASAIFNEVHNALKQKNADLFPISVSYFPVSIPQGTLFYHATRGSKEIPTVPEWLAMDYEFSYNFAHLPRVGGRGGHPGKGRPGKGGPPGGGKWGPGKGKGGDGGGKNFHSDGNELPILFTFESTRPLNKLIYLGGASAAKTSTGEMDTQYLWSNITEYDDFNERVGATEICAWGKEHGGLDGVVRLEVGFEIIFCDFFDGLKLVNNVTLSNTTDIIGLPAEKAPAAAATTELPTSEEDNKSKDTKLMERSLFDSSNRDQEVSSLLDVYSAVSGFDHYQAGVRVYDKEPRILIDFSKYITLINKTYISPDPYVRRINNISTPLKNQLFSDLEWAQSFDNNPYHTTNWQVVTEAITEKFSPILLTLNNTFNLYHLASQDPDLLDEVTQFDLATNISAYTYNFVRRYVNQVGDIKSYDKPVDFTKAKEFAIWEYSHNFQPMITKNELLIWNSVYQVTNEIVSVLFDLFEYSTKVIDYELRPANDIGSSDFQAKGVQLSQRLVALLSELRWSDFHRCSNACGWDELCFVPTWGPSPLGWGGDDLLGTVKGADGIPRIPYELQCISYKTVMKHNS